MKRHSTSPSILVASLLADFVPNEPREEKFVDALRELVALQSFDSKMRLIGPRLDISSIARRATCSRNLVSHEDCELSSVRELILEVLKQLSEYSLQVECDYLKEEVKRLRARLDRQDSILANRVVSLYEGKRKAESALPKRYTAEQVRNAVRIVPMEEL